MTLVGFIFLEMSYLMSRFFPSIVIPKIQDRLMKICVTIIWTIAVLIWVVIICVFVCLLILCVRKIPSYLLWLGSYLVPLRAACQSLAQIVRLWFLNRMTRPYRLKLHRAHHLLPGPHEPPVHVKTIHQMLHRPYRMPI